MYKGGIPQRSYVIEVSLLILCVVFPGELKATAVTGVGGTLSLKFLLFESYHFVLHRQATT